MGRLVDDPQIYREENTKVNEDEQTHIDKEFAECKYNFMIDHSATTRRRSQLQRTISSYSNCQSNNARRDQKTRH